MRSAVGHVLHPHRGQRGSDALAHLVVRHAEVERTEGDVLGDGRHEQLVVGILEDEPDRRAQLAHVAFADPDAGDLELALAASAGR